MKKLNDNTILCCLEKLFLTKLRGHKSCSKGLQRTFHSQFSAVSFVCH